MISRRRFKRWLITDLDGTFLGGPETIRARLSDLLSSEPRDVGLIYCSGRALSNISPLIDSGDLPEPSAIIGDVGTGLWDAQGRTLSSDFDDRVAGRWSGVRPLLLARLHGLEGLELQAGTGPNRCSFLYSTRSAAETAARAVHEMDVDTLISGGRFFDVLPRGVNKGFAVKFLIELWGLDPSGILVAGDSLNDLSMLRLTEDIAGLHALAVGNADDDLRAHFRESGQARYSKGHGAEGICERLEQLGWVA